MNKDIKRKEYISTLKTKNRKALRKPNPIPVKGSVREPVVLLTSDGGNPYSVAA
jgi:hypothetical protein